MSSHQSCLLAMLGLASWNISFVLILLFLFNLWFVWNLFWLRYELWIHFFFFFANVTCRCLLSNWGISLLLLGPWELSWMHVNFIKCSLCILCYDHVVYLLYVVNIVDYMNWFLNTSLALHSQKKAHFFFFFLLDLIWFDDMFEFYVQVHEGYCFEFFFFLYCLLSVFRY